MAQGCPLELPCLSPIGPLISPMPLSYWTTHLSHASLLLDHTSLPCLSPIKAHISPMPLSSHASLLLDHTTSLPCLSPIGAHISPMPLSCWTTHLSHGCLSPIGPHMHLFKMFYVCCFICAQTCIPNSYGH